MKLKVLAYITRNSGREVLVFDHRDKPEAGVQVPAGTVDEGEDILTALKREVFEEAGITVEDAIFIGKFPFRRPDTGEDQLRHVFHLPMTGLRDSWEHEVSGNGDDQHLLFKYYWMPVEKAKSALAVSMGNYLVEIGSPENDI